MATVYVIDCDYTRWADGGGADSTSNPMRVGYNGGNAAGCAARFPLSSLPSGTPIAAQLRFTVTSVSGSGSTFYTGSYGTNGQAQIATDPYFTFWSNTVGVTTINMGGLGAAIAYTYDFSSLISDIVAAKAAVNRFSVSFGYNVSGNRLVRIPAAGNAGAPQLALTYSDQALDPFWNLF